MIDISRISNKSILGKLLRLPLKLIPDTVVLPILSGSLRGKKWIKGSGVSGYWLGVYEADKQRIFMELVNEGDIIYDVGAHAGFYTLLASNLVKEKGEVVAFEPAPKNFEYLKRHLELNSVKNVKAFPVAVSNEQGSAYFTAGHSSSTGKLSKEGKLNVDTVALDCLTAKNDLPDPDVMKIDVEGEEYNVLLGAKNLIQRSSPILLIALHGKKVKNKCVRFLCDHNYNIKEITEDEIIARRKS